MFTCSKQTSKFYIPQTSYKDKFLAKFDNKFYNTKALPLGGNHVNY
ncbi:hypothetical protein SMU26_05326 [Streptococcus mutans 3SN1]|nr:hypothetical protein SMU20_02591 [Streptococcus mutans 15JP3]EMB66295.1 hypothetical protein SMU26_05326 [Streptococcus mutans 3SN1]EMB75700.1 hypothetical protein SMU40_00641 [Streptococcus mutans 15VF2]EMB99732.1 hypothetical protein SMU63_05386 [Streptococcus mutans T4]EMC51956.1 hypothetical protein SMU104_03082 [Streptococcus mutans SA41]